MFVGSGRGHQRFTAVQASLGSPARVGDVVGADGDHGAPAIDGIPARESFPFSAGSGAPVSHVPQGACDCHVHVYNHKFPVALGARLLPPDASIADYAKVQARIGTSRVVLVTPSTYGTDNRSMLQALGSVGSDARGVAVIDGTESDDELQRLHEQGVRGIRLNLSLGVTGTFEMLTPLAHRIEQLGWHLQLLMAPELLAKCGEVLERLPIDIVFDHFGRLAPEQAGSHPAHRLLLRLLGDGRAWVKLSGGYIVSPTRTTRDVALRTLAASYLNAAPERVIWGSDWPHATGSAGLQPMPDDADQMDCLAGWTASDQLFRRVLVDNPQELYGFTSELPN